MEMINHYIFLNYIGYREPLPFPQYLYPQNRHKNDFWVTIEGEVLYPHEIRDSHLLNIIKKLDGANEFRKREYDFSKADSHIQYGPSAKVSRKISKSAQYASYLRLWKEHRLYMLLRREAHIRGLIIL